MKLSFSQLRPNLERGLAPVYLIAGEEPMQALLAADSVRSSARDQGYEERLILDADSGFDWARLRDAAGNLSLFAQRRLLDLRWPSAKPGVAGSKALVDYANRPPSDTVLLITCGKLDRDTLTSAWLQALDRAGVVLQIWPLNARETVQWIQARLAGRGLKLERDAVNLLAERAQGNLLAANQEIEKLSLLYGEGHVNKAPLDREKIFADISDSARYTIFDLADAALAGDCAKAVRTLHGLAAEDTKPALVLWLLAEALRALAAMSQPNERGTPAQPLKKSALLRRLPLLKRALTRESRAGWEAWLARCAHADRVIKGREPGEPWDELLNLTLGLCGKPLFVADEGL